MNADSRASSATISRWPFYFAAVLLFFLAMAIWGVAYTWDKPSFPSWQLIATVSGMTFASMLMLVWPAVLQAGLARAISPEDLLAVLQLAAALPVTGAAHGGEPMDQPLSAPTEAPETASSAETAAEDAAVVEVEQSIAPVTTVENVEAFDELQQITRETQARMERLEESLSAMNRQVSLLPNQTRMLGSKIDSLTTSVSESRVRDLLNGLLGIYDLLSQIMNTPTTEGEATHRRNYTVLHTQLRQLLEANGLEEIPTEGAFTPELHRAVQRKACEDPALAGQILEVVRAGFRTEHQILRYADVIVGYREGAPDSADAPVPSPGNA